MQQQRIHAHSKRWLKWPACSGTTPQLVHELECDMASDLCSKLPEGLLATPRTTPPKPQTFSPSCHYKGVLPGLAVSPAGPWTLLGHKTMSTGRHQSHGDVNYLDTPLLHSFWGFTEGPLSCLHKGDPWSLPLIPVLSEGTAVRVV